MSTSPTRTAYSSLADFAPEWAIPPGETIAEALTERGWTQVEFAERIGSSIKQVNQLMHGLAPITQETAEKLEVVLGSTARFWGALEFQFRVQLSRRKVLAALESETGWLKELPLAHMKKFGWIKPRSSKTEQVLDCLKFFAVWDVNSWRNKYSTPVAAYRAAPKLTRNPVAVSTWLRQCERKSVELFCDRYSESTFKAVLNDLRDLSKERSPDVFLPKLTALCASAGVAVVLEPAPPGCPVSGATKWLSSDKALIMLSVRGKTDDKLWFTFFHEAGHILLHGKSLTFLDILGEDGLDPIQEDEANVFARNRLIPPNEYERLVGAGLAYSANRVVAFAAEIGVSPGVVVGRLQHDKHLPSNYLNKLKVSYRWTP